MASLAFSKFWLRINVSGDPNAWPNRLFWTDGPWIPTPAYFLQAVLVVLWAAILWLSYRAARRAGDTAGTIA